MPKIIVKFRCALYSIKYGSTEKLQTIHEIFFNFFFQIVFDDALDTSGVGVTKLFSSQLML
jgi:hypothetical protein